MIHIQGHIDSDKQQNLDLSDLTQCKYCYKQFDTPFEMQCHVEKVSSMVTLLQIVYVSFQSNNNLYIQSILTVRVSI